MNWLRTCGRRMRTALSSIHLVDKCLILFMIVLLIQSIYSLFLQGDSGAETGSIDVVVRTSSASIFGYFLSANFIRHDKSREQKTDDSIKNTSKTQISPLDKSINENPSGVVEGPKGRIGFAETGAPEEVKLGVGKGENLSNDSPPAEITASRLQIIAATGIGLLCLAALIVLRNIAQFSGTFDGPPSDSAAATVTQFRDFISGCVGFLIGCPTHSKSKS